MQQLEDLQLELHFCFVLKNDHIFSKNVDNVPKDFGERQRRVKIHFFIFILKLQKVFLYCYLI